LFQICADPDEPRETILKNQKPETKERYMVFLTEVIHETSGIDYLKDLLNILRSAFDKLPSDVRVVVKFHPRETGETKKIFKENFPGKRYSFLENAGLFPLLRSAQLSIGHYSKALETSFLAGTPVLSINFGGSEQYSLYGKDKTMECKTPQEFEKKLMLFFSEDYYRKKAKESIKSYIKENVCAMDGNNTRRATKAILRYINISKAKE